MDSKWRVIPGTDERYEASIDGVIRQVGTGREIQPRGSDSDVRRSSITVGRHQRAFATHVLVGMTWLDELGPGQHYLLRDPSRPWDVSLGNIVKGPRPLGARYVQKRPPR